MDYLLFFCYNESGKGRCNMIENFLRAFPYLKPVNIYNLFERFLEASKGTMLLLYNTTRDLYELHSIKSFQLNGESLQAVIEEDMLSGWLINDYKANDINKFGLEIQSERELTNKSFENSEDKGLELLTTKALKTIETMVGREI